MKDVVVKIHKEVRLRKPYCFQATAYREGSVKRSNAQARRPGRAARRALRALHRRERLSAKMGCDCP